jgi:hypothetical protein
VRHATLKAIVRAPREIFDPEDDASPHATRSTAPARFVVPESVMALAGSWPFGT